MSSKAAKKNNVRSQTFSTGVEIGSWGAPAGNSLPAVEINLEQLASDLKADKEAIDAMADKIENSSDNIPQIPARILYGPIY